MGSGTLVLSLAAAATVAHAQAVAAQALPGWMTILETQSYDFMVSLESITEVENPGDSIAPQLTGVHLNRMLVRHQERARQQLVTERAADGASTEGYASYASSTDVYWVDCVRRRVSLRQTVDFDVTGSVIERRDTGTSWRTPADGPHGEAVAPMVDWLCRYPRNLPPPAPYGWTTAESMKREAR